MINEPKTVWVNINATVRCRLSDTRWVIRGYEPDTDGYITAPLWVLMNDLGPHCIPGRAVFDEGVLGITVYGWEDSPEAMRERDAARRDV